MASTAGWLCRRGQEDFEKMSRVALAKLRLSSREDEEEEGEVE